MATPSYTRSLVSATKRLRLSSNTAIVPQQCRQIQQSSRSLAQPTLTSPVQTADANIPPTLESVGEEMNALRLPKSVQATYLQPLRRKRTHSIKVCELYLRSYNVRNVEIFADFAARAAYYLNLPITGPSNLPQITERWTVPRSNFVHKKSQENFERKTLRRVINVYDGHPETVAIWLAFLKKHQYYGVGLKAHVYEHGSLDTVNQMDQEVKTLDDEIKEKFALFGTLSKKMVSGPKTMEWLFDQPFKAAFGASAASSGAPSVTRSNEQLERIVVENKDV